MSTQPKMYNVKYRNDEIPNYLMDENGTILSLKSNTILSPQRTVEGHAFVTLTFAGKRKGYRLDVLIVSTLFGYPDDTVRIDHLDEDKMNCNPKNLKVVTKSSLIEKYKDFYKVDDLSEVQEEWKVYPATPQIEVSNFGRLRNKETLEPIEPYMNHGYMLIFRNNTHYQVHRMVAELFVENPKPDEYIYVNHIDGVKHHNEAHNLEWCNISMNTTHAHQTGLYKTYSEKDIRKVCELLEKSVPYADIEEVTGVKQKYISEIYTGRKCKSISVEYNFPRRMSLDELYNKDLILTFIRTGVTPKEAAKVSNVEYNQSFISYYERLQRQERRKKKLQELQDKQSNS